MVLLKKKLNQINTIWDQIIYYYFIIYNNIILVYIINFVPNIKLKFIVK